MAVVFLMYLLCAITDCPPPVSLNHDSQLAHAGHLLPSASSATEIRHGRSFDGEETDTQRAPEIPAVHTSLGEFRGRLLETRNGRPIAAFEGIPYALPPVGHLRFRNPIPIKWPADGAIFIANKTQNDCLQLDMGRSLTVRGVEDCLYLNVFVPEVAIHFANQPADKNRTNRLLPVMVFIHGGGWMSHSSAPYGPRFLLEKDVILVTFNFRLGVLGFLSTGDDSAHGNFGLKDQVLALKWVVDHIADFGGDPKKVTLMGESTGAGSAALHVISPLTAKAVTIQGAILFSGGSRNHWSIMNDTFFNTKRIAEKMHCPTGSSERLVECLRLRDPYLVVGQQMNLWRIPVVSRLLFGPVIESPLDNPAPFITEAPEVTYSRPNSIRPIPVISGINRNEGAMFTANIYLVPFLFRRINKNWKELAAYSMAYDRLPGVNASEVSEKVSKFYSFKRRWSTNNMDDISNALGDRTITTGVYKFLQSHSQVAPTYGYFFTYHTKSFIFSMMGLKNKEWGVSHGDELPFIFSTEPFFDEFTDPEALELSNFMVNVCTNFATDRQPWPENRVSKNVTWSPILNPKYMELLEINTKRKMVPFPYIKRMKFWESLNLN